MARNVRPAKEQRLKLYRRLSLSKSHGKAAESNLIAIEHALWRIALKNVENRRRFSCSTDDALRRVTYA